MHTSGFTNYQDIYFNVQLLNIIALQTPIINKKGKFSFLVHSLHHWQCVTSTWFFCNCIRNCITVAGNPWNISFVFFFKKIKTQLQFFFVFRSTLKPASAPLRSGNIYVVQQLLSIRKPYSPSSFFPLFSRHSSTEGISEQHSGMNNLPLPRFKLFSPPLQTHDLPLPIHHKN